MIWMFLLNSNPFNENLIDEELEEIEDEDNYTHMRFDDIFNVYNSCFIVFILN